MKVLLDVRISPHLRLPPQNALVDTPVESAVFHRWRTLRDDELLAQASLNGFEVDPFQWTVYVLGFMQRTGDHLRPARLR